MSPWPGWVNVALVGTALAIQVLLAIDRWVHRQSDSTDDFQKFRGEIGQKVSDYGDEMQKFMNRSEIKLTELTKDIDHHADQIKQLWLERDRRRRQ